MRPWCQDGSTRRCQRRRPGSSPGGRLLLVRRHDSAERNPAARIPAAAAGHTPEGVGFSPPQPQSRKRRLRRRNIAAVRTLGLLVARTVVCIHQSGVRFPGAPSTRSRTRLGRGSVVSRVRRVRLPSRALTTRRSSAEPSTTLRRWGTEVRILPARLLLVRERDSAERSRAARIPACGGAHPWRRRLLPPHLQQATPTAGRLGRRRSDTAVKRGSIPRSSISP